jgi:hypothetical protein
MTNKKLYLKADISDWRDEAYQDEFLPESKDEIMDAVETGKHTAEIARATIVSREVGHAPDDIIRENKLLVMSGAMNDISRMVRNTKTEIETVSGKTWKVPAFLGHPTGEDVEQSYVSTDTNKGKVWAEKYLETAVVSHIRNRLATIYQNGGDVTEAADKLKSRIDGLIAGLLEPARE